MNVQTYQSRSQKKVIATVVAVVVVIGIVVIIELVQAKKPSTSASVAPTTTSTTTTPSTNSSSSTTTPSTSSSTSSSDSSSSSASTYKDGTYTADASYYVPHGSEDIKVTLTVANGVVTDSSIVNSESDHDSARYQEEFAADYQSQVVGKNLADINLSYVAGASDTTEGFNDALTQIRTQATS